MRAYSKEFRERAVEAMKRGEKPLSIAKRLEVSLCWVYSIWSRYRKTGNYEALPNNAGAKLKLSTANLELLKQTVQEHPDATLEELKELTGFNVSVSTICRALKRLKLSLKKNTSRKRTKSSGRARGEGELEKRSSNIGT
jgi:transposase